MTTPLNESSHPCASAVSASAAVPVKQCSTPRTPCRRRGHEHRGGVRLGVARVHDDRAIEFGGEGELRREDLPLHVARTVS